MWRVAEMLKWAWWQWQASQCVSVTADRRTVFHVANLKSDASITSSQEQQPPQFNEPKPCSPWATILADTTNIGVWSGIPLIFSLVKKNQHWSKRALAWVTFLGTSSAPESTARLTMGISLHKDDIKYYGLWVWQIHCRRKRCEACVLDCMHNWLHDHCVQIMLQKYLITACKSCT